MKISKILSVLFVLIIIGSPESKAQESREFGLNVRNVWLGSNLHILYRKKLNPDQWRRIDASISPSFSTTRAASTFGNRPVPEEFRTISNSSVSFGIRFVKEKHVKLDDKFTFYHGFMFNPLIDHSKFNNIGINLQGQVTLATNTTQNLNLGFGYLAGLRYPISNRFAVGIDTDMALVFAGSLVNQEVQTYDAFTTLIDSSSPRLDELNTSIYLSGTPNTRLWLLFTIK